MIENEDYELVPVDWTFSEQGWDVRILKGDYTETVIRFGNVGVQNGELHFNFWVQYSPIDASTDDVSLQDIAGQILLAVIDDAIKSDAVKLTDRESKQTIMKPSQKEFDVTLDIDD